MLLPFDWRADREGWTVFEVATDKPAFLEGVPLTGLRLADAEDAVNALNKLEIACQRAARMMLDPRVLSGARPSFELNQSRGGPATQNAQAWRNRAAARSAPAACGPGARNYPETSRA
jgi:hypothetical protein